MILIGILVVQVILSAVVFWPSSAADDQSEPLFPDLESDAIVAVTITNDAGESIALAKVVGDWVLPEADDYPADETKIEPLLTKILELATGRLITRNETSHRQLQVAADSFMRLIEFETDQGEEFTVYLGSSPSYGATHFRLDGQNEAYLTNSITIWDAGATASSWIDTTYLGIPQADVISLTLENSHGTFSFRRDDEGNWTMDGLAADESLVETRVTSAVRQASTVNMLEPLGLEELDSYGMDEPSAVATFETADAEYTLYVGAQNPDDETYVVISSESDYYVRVSNHSVSPLVENTREDLIEQPSETTSE
jgi:hypothetical protein